METPNSEQEFNKLLQEIMNLDPNPELSPAEIKFYGKIDEVLELVGDWVARLN